MNELKLDEIIHMIKQLSDEKQEELLKETEDLINRNQEKGMDEDMEKDKIQIKDDIKALDSVLKSLINNTKKYVDNNNLNERSYPELINMTKAIDDTIHLMALMDKIHYSFFKFDTIE